MLIEQPSTIELLNRSRAGDRCAFDALYERLYTDLKGRAQLQLRRLGPGTTLETTDLLHETYLRMLGEQTVAWDSRAYFLAIASRAMRRALVDHSRERHALKRGGGARPLTLSTDVPGAAPDPHTVIAIDRALTHLASFDERLPRVAECRLFGGLTEEETAQALGVSLRTVQRDWHRARAWLQQELRD
jgi:RNA polymerase sigma factor (TIGR02999 family)